MRELTSLEGGVWEVKSSKSDKRSAATVAKFVCARVAARHWLDRIVARVDNTALVAGDATPRAGARSVRRAWYDCAYQGRTGGDEERRKRLVVSPKQKERKHPLDSDSREF